MGKKNFLEGRESESWVKEIAIEFARLFNIDEQIFIAKYLNDTEVFTKYIKMEFLQNVG